MARRPVLENAVMNALWDQDGWLTPSQVRARMTQQIAPTTIGTVLTRLQHKGRVERRPRGKAYQYRPTQTREEYVAAQMDSALGSSHDRSVALLEFIDRLPDDDRSFLRRILRS